MLQADEAARGRWLGLLARAPLAVFEGWAAGRVLPSFRWLRRPESGLVMLRGRAGGTGAKFNLGEATLTRCALVLDSGASGLAWVLGRSARQAELAALADALLQTAGEAESVRRALLEPLAGRLAEAEAAAARRTAETRVEFFTLVRGEG